MHGVDDWNGSLPDFSTPTIGEFAEAHPTIVSDLKDLDPLTTITCFSAMLTMPELQANCFRIETAIHLAAGYCGGSKRPTKEFARRTFHRLGTGYCGGMEDPSEDLFLALVSSPEGNFRVFQGIREGHGFYLQIILNIVEGMPKSSPFLRLRKTIHSLLKLSDQVAQRAGLKENSLGTETPYQKLPKYLVSDPSPTRNYIRFTEADLIRLDIASSDLADFVFDLKSRARLRNQAVGHSDLERRPLTFNNGSFTLVLPSAVGSAITRHLVDTVLTMNLADSFERALVDAFAQVFEATSILGNHSRVRIPFHRVPGGWIGSVVQEPDPGRVLHLLFFVDGLDGFREDSFNGSNAHPEALSRAVTFHLNDVGVKYAESGGFREGITLMVSAGLGRALRFALETALPPRWRLQSIAAHDLITLSRLDDFSPRSLWRLFESREALGKQGVSLMNVNGLLNLVAWARQLDGHLIPHGDLPDQSEHSQAQTVFLIQQNSLRNLRHAETNRWDPRRVIDVEGSWIRVRRETNRVFKEDSSVPFYVSLDDLEAGTLSGVYLAPRRPWWITIRAQEKSSRDSVYERWEMLCMWLKRAAPVLDEAYPKLLQGPIIFRIWFEEISGVTGRVEKNKDDIRDLVRTTVTNEHPIIEVRIAPGFDDGLMRADNICERTIVEAMVSSIAKLAAIRDVAQERALVQRICPNEHARWLHRFEARDFRDFMQPNTNTNPVLVTAIDDAACKIGLGWKVRERGLGPEILGVSECTQYLNSLVGSVLDDICKDLRTIDRRSLLDAALGNHEKAMLDAARWSRTSQANLALHKDTESAMQAIINHQARLNACTLASRILIEAAICECPLTEGVNPGELELSKLMARVMLVHHFGGWSDAVHWGAMEPRIKITRFGDIYMNHTFLETVYDPFGRLAGAVLLNQAVESYDQLFEPAKVQSSVEGVLEPQFLNAWNAEYGMSLDSIRAFVDRIEDLGLDPPRPYFHIQRSAVELLLAKASSAPIDIARDTLDLLLLRPREAWRVVSDDFTNKDWHPWRFGRRLSIIRRPFIQLDDLPDPTIIVAPGLVRDGLMATVRRFHEGEVSDSRSSDMRKWTGHANRVQRGKFNSTVASRMRELGWVVDQEARLTKLLGQSFDRDFGDIDVLAWRPNSGRVLAIECKDLQFRKTLGEVAEQLSDFRGEVKSNGKPDDLRRHLDRLELLKANPLLISKVVGLTLPIEIEGHLVFRNVVPMGLALKHMSSLISICVFDDLDHL